LDLSPDKTDNHFHIKYYKKTIKHLVNINGGNYPSNWKCNKKGNVIDLVDSDNENEDLNENDLNEDDVVIYDVDDMDIDEIVPSNNDIQFYNLTMGIIDAMRTNFQNHNSNVNNLNEPTSDITITEFTSNSSNSSNLNNRRNRIFIDLISDDE